MCLPVETAILATRTTAEHVPRVSWHLVYPISWLYNAFALTNSFYDYSIKPFAQPPYPAGKTSTAVSGDEAGIPPSQLPWEGRAIATHKFRLLEFTAFMEIQRDDMVWHGQKGATFRTTLNPPLSINRNVLLITPFSPHFHSITVTSSFNSAVSHPFPIHCLRWELWIEFICSKETQIIYVLTHCRLLIFGKY